MQFFHLFSFVVAASYAVALPQAAELSEQYSNSADANLASGLEARSYQPGFNSQRDSAISMLLKRQDDSEGSDPPPSPVPAPDGSGPDLSLREKLQNDSLKLSFDIDSVGSGLDTLPEYMEKVGEAIGDRAGVLMVEYLKRILAINGFLEGWPRDLGDDIVKFIKAGLGDAEYSEVEPALTMRVQRARDAIQNSLQEAMDALSKILGRAGSVINNVEMASRSFGGLFYSYREFFRALGYQLGRFEAGKISSEYFTNIGTSIDMFMEKQLGLHNELLKTLKVAPSN